MVRDEGQAPGAPSSPVGEHVGVRAAAAQHGAEHRRAEPAGAGRPPRHTRDSRYVRCVPSRPDSRAPLWAHCPPQPPRRRAAQSWVLAERVGPGKTVG